LYFTLGIMCTSDSRAASLSNDCHHDCCP